MNTGNIKSSHKGRVTRDDLPITFSCAESGLHLNQARPTWTQQEFVAPVFWSVCPVKDGYDQLQVVDRATFSKCVEFTSAKWLGSDTTLRPMDLTEMKKWNYLVNAQGQLIIFELGVDSRSAGLSYSLMCYTKRRNEVDPIITFVNKYTRDDIEKGIDFDGSIGEDASLVARSPTVKYMDIFARVVRVFKGLLVVSFVLYLGTLWGFFDYPWAR